MAGTIAGGKKARDTNLAADPDFYRKIGAKGGAAGTGKTGFAILTLEQRRSLAAKGGTISRRRPKKVA